MANQRSGESYDAVVIGSGPNGLAAAITLARRGLAVAVLEAKDTVGGGVSTAELTLPGFHHDVCSAVHPLAVASPFFRSLPLAAHGLEFIHPPAPLAHPLDNGEVAMLERSVDATAAQFGGRDGAAYAALMNPLVARADALLEEVLRPPRVPRHPLLMARFVRHAFRAARAMADARFAGPAAKALLAGNAAHSILPLENKTTAAVALLLMVTGHAVGWPVPRGGSRGIADAMAGYLRALGGQIFPGRPVRAMRDLPEARAYLFDIAPPHVARIAGDALPPRTRGALERHRYGPGVFKIDWALSAPIPWANPQCARAATVHVGGTLEEVAASERAAWGASSSPASPPPPPPSERPFVLVAQQSLFDPTRAPAGRHTGWAYCHVPARCTVDMTDRIESQVERFAPGFRDTILARHIMSPAAVESHNANNIGGDITGGVLDARAVLTRLAAPGNPYATPNPSIYLCSASTPPGAGVHGMCGFHAARAALRRVFR